MKAKRDSATKAAAPAGVRTARPAQTAVRRGRTVRRRSAAKAATHWFFTVLSTMYVLAILWTSVVHAGEFKSSGTTAIPSISPGASPHIGVARPKVTTAEPFGDFWTPRIWRRSTGGEPDASINVRSYVERAARDEGVDPTVAEWIVSHESGHRPDATGDGGDSRGLWQINRVYHPEVSDRCAYDVKCSTRWSLRRIMEGYVDEWSTWKYRNTWFARAPR